MPASATICPEAQPPDPRTRRRLLATMLAMGTALPAPALAGEGGEGNDTDKSIRTERRRRRRRTRPSMTEEERRRRRQDRKRAQKENREGLAELFASDFFESSANGTNAP